MQFLAYRFGTVNTTALSLADDKPHWERSAEMRLTTTAFPSMFSRYLCVGLIEITVSASASVGDGFKSDQETR